MNFGKLVSCYQIWRAAVFERMIFFFFIFFSFFGSKRKHLFIIRLCSLLKAENWITHSTERNWKKQSRTHVKSKQCGRNRINQFTLLFIIFINHYTSKTWSFFSHHKTFGFWKFSFFFFRKKKTSTIWYSVWKRALTGIVKLNSILAVPSCIIWLELRYN